jgi:hypothetical protein
MLDYRRAAVMHHCSNNWAFGKLQTPSLSAKKVFDCSGDLYQCQDALVPDKWHSMGTISAGSGHGPWSDLVREVGRGVDSLSAILVRAG